MIRYDVCNNLFEGFQNDAWIPFAQQATDACDNIILNEISSATANIKITDSYSDQIQFNISNDKKLIMDYLGNVGIGIGNIEDSNGNIRTLNATLDIDGSMNIKGHTNINNTIISEDVFYFLLSFYRFMHSLLSS